MIWIAELLKELARLPVSHERVAFFQDQLRKLEADKAALEKEATTLREQNAQLREKIVALTKANTFEEHDGVLWKREPDGAVKPIAYCPTCQLAMHTDKGNVYFNQKVECSKCGFQAPFKPFRVEQIAAELSKK
jgi:hypothetical protein